MIQIHFGFTAIVAVLLFGLLGCKKDRPLNTSGSDDSKIYYPLKITGANISTSYTYSPYPGILRSIVKKTGDSTTVYEMVYNLLNQPQYMDYFVNGNFISQTLYTLNPQGEVLKGEVFNIDGNWDYDIPATLKYYYTLTYNSSGQLSQVNYYHANGQKNYDEMFYYHPDGNISEIHSSDTISLKYDSFSGLGKVVKYAHLFYVEGRDHLLFFKKNNPAGINGTSRSYKYNNDRYPIEMKINYPAGTKVYKIAYNVK